MPTGGDRSSPVDGAGVAWAGGGVGSRGLCIGQSGLSMGASRWRSERWGQTAGGPEPTSRRCRSCRTRAASSSVAAAASGPARLVLSERTEVFVLEGKGYHGPGQ